MDDDPDLPSTCVNHSLSDNGFSYQLPDQVAPSRKRSREYDPTFSSDPAFFSSDDFLDTSADDYIHGTQKKKYRGTWWDKKPLESKPEGKPQGKREFKRNIDSGIWIPEEDEVYDLMATDPLVVQSSSLHSWPRSFGSRTIKRAHSDLKLDIVDNGSSGAYEKSKSTDDRSECVEAIGMRKKRTVFLTNFPNAPNAAATRIVEQCVDNGNQYVHLSYESFLPGLHVFLSNNLLRSLPMGLFDLEMLSVLSLRGNELTEIPPVIDRLSNLKELNISGNQLRFLPWEILTLIRGGKLETLILGTNQLVQVDQFSMPDSKHQKDEEHRRIFETAAAEPWVPRSVTTRPKPWAPEFLAATAVSYFEVDSTRHRESPASPSLLARTKDILSAASPDYVPAPPDFASPSFAPSLIEISLRSCAGDSNLSELSDLLPSDCPEILPRLIEEAESSKNIGGKKCSVCGRSYIIARTEWIEWWGFMMDGVDPDDKNRPRRIPVFHGQLPLLRKGCSWRCVVRGDG
ncbi:MAG: hypothetical protein M1836_007804 [Candelina mexicana]|nr:MAG: hypothetical protein M1836_007804 [Candelina mexicana]